MTLGSTKLLVELGAAFGMLAVDTIAKIRRAFFVEKKPIKAICRELKRSRTAVRKSDPLGGDGVPLRTQRSADAEAWRLAGAA